ncbi:MAG: aldehyde dehydrogenase family protein, partial [Balneola sp.]
MSESTTKETTYKPTSPNSKLDFASLWEYAPAPESSDNLEIKDKYELFIGGKFQKPSKGRYFKSVNPASGEEVTQFAEATQKDVDKAVKSARKAFNGEWSQLSAKSRAKYIYRIARMLQERAREFAIAESIDGGKPIRESRDVDIPLAAAYFFYYAGWADKLEYAFPGKKPEALGVCGQIIPWNFP